MSIKISKENCENLESWLTLNLDSHISHKDTSLRDKNLLEEIKRLLGKSIFILYTSCNSDENSIHTKDSVRLYLSIISSMATGIVVEKVMREVEENTTGEGTEQFIMNALQVILDPDRYLKVNEEVKDISLRVEEIIGPSIQWWLKNELHLNLSEDFKKLFIESLKENGGAML